MRGRKVSINLKIYKDLEYNNEIIIEGAHPIDIVVYYIKLTESNEIPIEGNILNKFKYFTTDIL